MALEKEEAQESQQNAPFCSLDALYCEEETSFVVEEEEEDLELDSQFSSPLIVLDDLFSWDDDELLNLLSKETNPPSFDDGFLICCRKEALDWVLKAKSHHGFTSMTAFLSLNYFDRFITSIKTDDTSNKPWMSQLVAVASLSLAAKVEEVHVPLLFDLQVEEARYVFEAKTIQRMELLILSTLQWRMHPVTPISFFDHIIRRFGSKCHYQQLEFFRECERLLISIVYDSRFMRYVPSVLATAIMIYVIKELRPCDEEEVIEYQSQLMTLLKANQEKVNECYELLLEHNNPSKKRKITNWLDLDSDENSSMIIVSSLSSSSSSTSESSLFKRRRVQEQQMKLPSLINRMFFDAITSPR